MFHFQNFNGTLDHRRELAYFNLRWTLWLNRAELTKIFEAASALNDNLKEIVTKSYDANASWTTVGDLNMGPGTAFTAALQATDDGRGAYAGLIFVLLRTITKRFKDEFKPDQAAWEKLPKMASGYTVYQIIRSCSNNVRHYDEWKSASVEKNENNGDIKILDEVMGYHTQPQYLNLQFGRNICWLVFGKLWRTYGELEQQVCAMADDLDLRRDFRQQLTVKVD